MSGTVKTWAQLLAEMPTGGPAGGIIPADLQDFIATTAAAAGYGTSALTVVAAAGSTRGDATQLTTFSTSINPVGAGQGVLLMSFANAPLVVQKVINDGLNTLVVYPPLNVSIGYPNARLVNQGVLVPIGGTLEVAMTSSSTAELVAAIGDPIYIPQRMGVTGGYRNINPPWYHRLANNNDVVNRQATEPNTSTGVWFGLAKPAYLGSVTDPYYGTKITRISGDPGTTMTNVTGGIWGRVSRHHYSTDQAWNCDESLLALVYNNEAAGGSGLTFTMTTNGTTANGNNTLHFAGTGTNNPSNSGAVFVGAIVTGTNIPANTTIVSWTSTTIVMNNTATSTGVASSATITIVDPGAPNSAIILDGQSYVPLYAIAPGGGDPRWHPTLPYSVFYIAFSDNRLYLWDIRGAGPGTLLVTFTGYTSFQIGWGHGSITKPVGYEATPLVVFVCTRNSDSHIVAFSFDTSLATGSSNGITGKSPDIDISGSGWSATGQWTAAFVSATGTYLVTSDSNEIVYVFNRLAGTFHGGPYPATGVQSQPSHYDITVDQAGNEVIVGVDKVTGANEGRICSLRLADGVLQYVSPNITTSTNGMYGSHCTTQSQAFPGWCEVWVASRYENDPSTQTNWPLYCGELVAFPLDYSLASATTSGGYRLGHHFTTDVPANYYAEAQASLSPSGTRVIFGSTWGNPTGDVRPVQCYVLDLRAQVQLPWG